MYLGTSHLKDYGYRAVYEVPIQGDSTVFMSVSPSCYMENRSVVIVEPKRFLELWRASPYSLHRYIAHGTPSKWKNDKKYRKAENGFSSGIINPVTLAEVNFLDVPYSLFPEIPILRRITKQHPFVTFTNGITRTICI